MTQKEFFNLYGNLRLSSSVMQQDMLSVPSMETIEYNHRYFCISAGKKSDREFRCKPKFKIQPISEIDEFGYRTRNFEKFPDKEFKGFLKEINGQKGTLKVYNIERDKEFEYKWDEIDLKKLNYTYKELLEKM